MLRNIAIVGAGAVGLSTALNIQNAVLAKKICIFADKFDEDTLSAGAGGLYRPFINMHSDQSRVLKWWEDSLQHFLEIVNSPDAAAAGIQLISGFHLSSCNSELAENSLAKALLPMFRKLTAEEFELFPEKYKYGIFLSSFVADCRYYLKWMRLKFEQLGGSCVKRHISHLSEIPEDFDIIVNCTGLGAKQLLNDAKLVPIRGQTIKVKAPWIKHFYYGDDVYVIPGLDYVTLGGIKDYGSWDLNVNPYQKDWIWNQCTELVPSLKNAEIIKDWVGLRPYRSEVRVDANLMNLNGCYRKVVNNYGHGIHGISLSWGTAKEATELVEKIWKEKEFKAKL